MYNSKPKISVIVPVHNAGEHLRGCLDSLVNQTLKEIEIILVLDCPTDGSDRVAEEYALSDSRIKLLENSKNLHTGLSRNRGMEIAQGEYIGFHDHDDYSKPEMYELLYRKAVSDQLDVARCNFECVYVKSSETQVEEYKYPKISEDVSNKEWIYEYVAGDKISCVIWNHIYKADFLNRNNIKFLDSRFICSEDSIFFLEVYNKLQKLGTIPDYLYYHVFHSSNTGKSYSYRSIKNRISFFETLDRLLQQNGVDESKSHNWLMENVARSFYSASRQALILLPLKQAIKEIQIMKKSSLVESTIHKLFQKKNKPILRQLKPTIILFLTLVKKLF